jgi:membrane protein
VILAGISYFAIAGIYRFAPIRKNPEFRWINWGAGVATAMWLLGSGGFSLFVTYVGSLEQMFGSVGAIIILMLWFLLSSFCVLVGAEVNSVVGN